MGKQIVHEKQLVISIQSGDYLMASKNKSSLREYSSEMENDS
ncbi:12948_t:CDS:1, partial [Rhizophagus irregularis]